MTKTEICLTKQNKKARHMRPVPNANYGGQTQITCFVFNLRIITPLMMGELLRKAIINVFHWATSKRGAGNPIKIIIAQNVHKCKKIFIFVQQEAPASKRNVGCGSMSQ